MAWQNFYRELKRRHLVRVAGLYLVGAWLTVEIAATVFPLLEWPETSVRLVLIGAIAGLPVVLAMAWLHEAGGIRRSTRLAASLAVLVTGLVGVAAVARLPRATAPIQSVAVLPFADLSPAQDQEHFAEGVAEELMNRLAQNGLRVPARTSSFAFKGQNLDVAEIARRLNVQAVLEGSIMREGDSLRVSVKLIDARTEAVLWSDRFDRNVAGIFAIQDEISQAIVAALELRLAGSRAPMRRTRSAQAQELYFKGNKAWHEGTDAQLKAALQFYEQAIASDSTYALAYAGLAKTYAVLPSFGDYPVFDAMTRGKEAAARATALAPNLGEAYAALGQIAQNLEWDVPRALASYRNALRVSPNDAAAHQWYAEALMMTGQVDAATAEIARALELDPLSAPTKNLRAYQMLLRRDHPASLRLYQILIREHPDFRFGQLNFALAAMATREYGDASGALIAALPEFGPDVGVYLSALSDATDRAAASRIVERIEQTQRSSVAALLYAAIGERERAIEHLEIAYRTANDANLPYWLLHPLLDPLRRDARFQEIMRGVGVIR